MKSRRTSLRELAALCETLGHEDGVDPRHAARGVSRKKKKAIAKDRQLCRQAEVALHLALSDMKDQAAEGMVVVGVQPAPDASHLRVLVADARSDPDLDPGRLEELLERAEGGLRAAVTAALHRKRAPALTFVLVPGRPTVDGREEP